MIEEVIKDIKSAEAQADEIVRAANAEGKRIVLDAEIEAEKQKKISLQESKTDLRKAVSSAEEEAAIKRKQIIAEGEKQAAEFSQSKENEIDAKATEILDVLLNKYGCKQ